MAIDDGYDFTEQRTGPKAFTEYTFNALLVLVGLIGSFFSVLGAASFYIMILPLFLLIPSPFYGTAIFSGFVGLAMIPIGIFQLYYAWKIHTENFTEFHRIIIMSWILIVLSVLSAILMGFLIIMTIQLVIAQLLMNILVIFFLSKNEVQQEFTWQFEGGAY